jgi:hypothetical protein
MTQCATQRYGLTAFFPCLTVPARAPPMNPQHKPPPKIFVFGSNLAGRRGKNAALFARQNCGAVQGQGAGL